MTTACPQCQTELRDTDHFCPKCGMARPAPPVAGDEMVAFELFRVDPYPTFVKDLPSSAQWMMGNYDNLRAHWMLIVAKARALLCGPKDAEIAKLTADLETYRRTTEIRQGLLGKIASALIEVAPELEHTVENYPDLVCKTLRKLKADLEQSRKTMEGWRAEALKLQGCNPDGSLAAARRPQSNSRARRGTLEQVIGVIDRVRSGCMGRTADKLAEVRAFCIAERDACPDSAPAVDLEEVRRDERKETLRLVRLFAESQISPWNSDKARFMNEAWRRVLEYVDERTAPDTRQPAAGPQPPAVDEKRAGIYGKYRVERTDGSSEPGGKHEHCEYYVLDWKHDKFAVPAAFAYARACRKEFPVLSRDLMATAFEYADKHGGLGVNLGLREEELAVLAHLRQPPAVDVEGLAKALRANFEGRFCDWLDIARAAIDYVAKPGWNR